MQAAGVPIVPGAERAGRRDRPRARAGARGRLSGDGEGRGRRRREGDAGGAHAGGAARRARDARASEALKAFGDASVYLEKFIERPRHVEIQVLADDSRTIHLGERECSIQRRHQKLVEEAPSVAVDAELREWMGAAAVSAAEAVGYRGAGTCEFLLAADRLVLLPRDEHPHPGRASGDRAGLRRGPGAGAAPHRRRRADAGRTPAGCTRAAGPSSAASPARTRPTASCRAPAGSSTSACPAGPGVRWDGGVDVGDEVTLYYDSMLAKLIVWAPDRAAGHHAHAARARRAGRRWASRPTRGSTAGCWPIPRSRTGEHRHPVPRPAPGPDRSRRSRTAEVLQLAVAAALAEDEARRARRPAGGGDDRPRGERLDRSGPGSRGSGDARCASCAWRPAATASAGWRTGAPSSCPAPRRAIWSSWPASAPHKRFARARLGAACSSRRPTGWSPAARTTCGTSAAAASSSTSSAGAQREARRGFVGDALRRLARRDVADPPLVPAPSASSTTAPRSRWR